MHFEETGNPNLLFVESTQDAGRGCYYRLVFVGSWRCSCPGYQFRRRCKHAFEANAIFGAPHRPAPAAAVINLPAIANAYAA